MQKSINTQIIAGFPGTGKTYAYEALNKWTNIVVLDSDSSHFDKSEFPQNYIRHITDNIGRVDVIFVSTHEEVRNALQEANIDYILVYPSKDLKDDYLKRYHERGSTESFIWLLSNKWDEWITGCSLDNTSTKKIELNTIDMSMLDTVGDLLRDKMPDNSNL